ncbi:hypothetical protein ACEWY4_022186 [Coilia grayii]|uniref:Uncharacterized protein n=1 Tax=Coilia grayii TaxID=363190 RepID=A0ABD1J8R5_9TELE
MAKSRADELYALNTRRETWCRIEADSKFWQRRERRHFSCHLQNSYNVGAQRTVQSVGRTAWMERSPSARLAERKHFEDSSESKIPVSFRNVCATVESAAEYVMTYSTRLKLQDKRSPLCNLQTVNRSSSSRLL